MMDNKVAFQLAIGNLSPDNLEVLDNWNPDKDMSPYAFKPSIWSRSYKKLEQTQIVTKKDIVTIPNTKNKNVILDIRIPLIPLEQQINENYIKKEIESLYFEEPPPKKICLEKTEKVIDKTISPVLNRRNVFIKSRFFTEKTEEIKSPIKKELTDVKSDINESSEKTPAKNQLPDKNESQIESPVKQLNEPLNEINLESQIKNENSFLVDDDSNSIDVLNGSQKENGEQVKNKNSICRSRFFSVDSTEIVLCKDDTADITKIELKETTVIEKHLNKDRNFKRSQSLEEKIFKLEQISTISTKSTACRRPGLSRKNSASKFTAQKNQPKLNMFFKST